eukprot:11021126-Alexandrium_andersonii.AAC.1
MAKQVGRWFASSPAMQQVLQVKGEQARSQQASDLGRQSQRASQPHTASQQATGHWKDPIGRRTRALAAGPRH